MLSLLRRYGLPILVAATGAIVIALVLLFARGNGEEGPAGIPRTTVTFPVLWAGEDPSGAPIGGIEPAGVTVESMKDPAFDIDLETIKAKGAGGQWLASSTAAATVATLLTGADPQTIDVSYNITGPIDGPSGGAALTVATIAAIRGDTVRPRITMTGTISPDGTIGSVGGVPTKLRAAADDGYDTVLIPFGNVKEFNPETGAEESMIALGKKLGVRVVPTSNVGTAYKVFAGISLAPPVTAPPLLSSEARKATQETTRALVARVSRQLAGGSAEIPRRELPALRAQVARARSALAARDFATAYGLGVDATNNIGRALERARINTLIDREGLPAARSQLSTTIAKLTRDAEALVQSQSNPAGLSMDQQLSLPAAMSWAIYSRSMLGGLRTFLSRQRPGSREAFTQVSEVLADIKPSLTVFGPDALTVVKASPARSEATAYQTAEFMSGYSNFLFRAGEANRALYKSLRLGAIGEGTAGDVYLPFEAISKSLSSDDLEGVDSLQSETIQLANATTYYILGTVLVSGQSFGLSGFGFGKDPTLTEGSEPLLRASVIDASQNASAWEGYLQWAGVNMGYSVWSTRWGTATFQALEGTSREEAGAVIALNEVWYTALTSLMSRAAQIHLGS